MARASRRLPPASPPLLASVAFVCRQWPRVEALEHVTRELDALLDCSQLWTLARAGAAGLEHLVTRIAARDAQAMCQMDRLQRQALATTAMAAAAANGHVAVLRLLAEMFPRARVTKAVEAAARNGHVDVLQWLRELEQREALDVS
ncbi:Alpha- and gamma-adaptin-binding protein p34 [Phytophthora cinnamomi]|uniref:Alpha- and gamma-adaptin-binding protein p34 n=1 Tax=Phytophthora cinnamomi TaxID=4785 RepID=UPI00355A239F|nr:Alpha- and gamma-adaptin-binding protein p34 [Phytophthora cinnamomi]